MWTIPAALKAAMRTHNRLMIRNLKAVRELRQGQVVPAPNVSIGTAGQVNVAAVLPPTA